MDVKKYWLYKAKKLNIDWLPKIQDQLPTVYQPKIVLINSFLYLYCNIYSKLMLKKHMYILLGT